MREIAVVTFLKVMVDRHYPDAISLNCFAMKLPHSSG